MSGTEETGRLADTAGACPTLDAWLAEYSRIEDDFIEAVSGSGVEFAERNADAQRAKELRRRLRAKGAVFRNGGASVSVGALSSACAACVGDRGSRTFFLSLACNRSCFFCFNANQRDYEKNLQIKGDWRAELDDFLSGSEKPTHVGLTGGEPLLHPKETVEFFERVRRACPGVHTRLYTSGDLISEDVLKALANAGLREIRISVKIDLDEPVAQVITEALSRISLAKRFISDVMVEMPVIPGIEDAMRELMRGMEDERAFGINLLELCYPFSDWSPYAQRGLVLKNPPFAVLYDYGYAGGLPVAGSEIACLELLEWAIDEGLDLGVHYCSLDNKNRDQLLQQNLAVRLDPGVYELDRGDCLYKTLRLFDGDVPPAKELLKAAGGTWIEDRCDGSISTHPRYASLMKGLSPALSSNVVERTDSEWSVRELALRLFEEKEDDDGV